MDCPRCQANLLQDKTTWLCPQGHGRFVPAGSLPRRAERHLSEADVTFPSIQCPACGDGMHLYHPKGFDVDVCGCGSVWLDAGEEKALRSHHADVVWNAVEVVTWIGAGLGGLG